ncbi:MAG: alpha-N-arabinofuranosidase [Clostridia bacterium]|nr:alpha-N-arabinofuranosidase [Clostridia bacterium]
MKNSLIVNRERCIGKRDKMIFGQFIEHFHRIIYDGIYCPSSSLSDEDGFRSDVIEALCKIAPAIIRWPGGCFVSSYHWRDGVGERRTLFDKAWRVEEDNSFGTDEFVKLCQKLNCEPYICTNAGTGTAEEMSDWVEYCNLPCEGENAKLRIKSGNKEPHNVHYWSIGNENYGSWEIGAKTADEWALLVTESAKMMKRVDPTIQLSAAALSDVNWNLKLLERAGDYLDWISIHGYWDFPGANNECASYEQALAFTKNLDGAIKKVEGILAATGRSDKIKIAYDEWNLKGWYHPNSHTKHVPADKELYITPRDKNDDNSKYTMADAVFSACFLNTLLRHCNSVRMANYAPTVNGRGLVYVHDDGIVLRSTYHVFDMYINLLGEEVVDLWVQKSEITEVKDKWNNKVVIDKLDAVATKCEDNTLAIALVNKAEGENAEVAINAEGNKKWRLYTLNGESADSFNDVNHPDSVKIAETEIECDGETVKVILEPHSVNVLKAIE